VDTVLFKHQRPVTIQVNELPENLQSLFKADGLQGIPSPYRAPWFDLQEKKRKGNKRDFVCNVCGTPLGAADTPFDPEIIEQIRETTIREPDYEGELYFTRTAGGLVDREESIAYVPNRGNKRFKWWGTLLGGRPNQQHNYIIGIDPSYGLGSANSAAIVYDVNTKEQVGSWADANTKPEDFADIVVAMALWIGGVRTPFIIWESNAGCGSSFGKRIIYQRYYWVYTQRREDSKTRKRTQKYGWSSNTAGKESILGDLGVALSGGLAGEQDYLSIIIHDESLLDELADYVFKEKGAGIVQSSKADLGTGATERHGDRGIACALCILGAKDQRQGFVKDIKNPPTNSFEHRFREWKKLQEDDKQRRRRFLF